MTFLEATQITTPAQWCVVVTSLECDPQAHGPFSTQAEARTAQRAAQARFSKDCGDEGDAWEATVCLLIPTRR